MTKNKMTSDPGFDELGASEFVQGAVTRSSKNNSNKASSNKQQIEPEEQLKSHALSLKVKHINMLNELNEKTMIPKQKILRMILEEGIENLYSEKIKKPPK